MTARVILVVLALFAVNNVALAALVALLVGGAR